MPPMGKYILGAVFVVLLALNVVGYLYLVNEIDGSTVKHTKTLAPPPQSDAPTR